MFNLFLRARLHRVFAARSDQFRARSLERDAETDRERIRSVIQAIERAMQAAENERDGLKGRVEGVLARAAVTIGTASDEYLDREPHRNHHQNLFDTEIINGQRRLDELAKLIGHFKFLRAAALSRFPDYAGIASK